MTRQDEWLAVDRGGLAKLIEERGRGRIVAELVQNALDEPITRVDVTLMPVDGRPLATLRVEDDAADGFKDLSHAWTLFAESYKKPDAEKRGRFNLGEKLVLVLCDEARIESTTGAVLFNADGTRSFYPRRGTERGSVFHGLLRITRADLAEVEAYLHRLLIPPGVVVTVNGCEVASRPPVAEFTGILQTEVARLDGTLYRADRTTTIRVVEPLPGEKPTLFEMGLPIVETGDRWHVDVSQRVPLNFERDNVTPAYLRRLRTLVVNHMHEHLVEADANASWVRDAAASPDCRPEAVTKIIDLRFGEKRVIYDPSDPEANKRAVAAGYTVIPAGSLGREEWENVRQATAALPAGRVTPSAKPYGDGPGVAKVVPPGEWTPGMAAVAGYAAFLGRELLGRDIKAIMVQTGNNFLACYELGELHLNLTRLGNGFFDEPDIERIDALLLHELAHECQSDHLSDDFHHEICRLAARLKRLAMEAPQKMRAAMPSGESGKK